MYFKLGNESLTLNHPVGLEVASFSQQLPEESVDFVVLSKEIHNKVFCDSGMFWLKQEFPVKGSLAILLQYLQVNSIYGEVGGLFYNTALPLHHYGKFYICSVSYIPP